MQRERERERERFETDRERDHGRRTIERSQSPSHIASRRPASPTASPSLSERIPSDSDRRVCCRSSERSGSCSSLSPPRFEKPDKARAERYNKTDKPEKDRVFEAERVVEMEKRAGRKDRGEKEKGEKQRLKKLKVASPSIPTCETEPELERDVIPDSALRSKTGKAQKEGSGKGRLDLLPCVVQLTRVKEKEGKLIGHAIQEKQRLRGGNDSPRLASPSTDQRSPPFRLEPSKGDITKHGKVPKDKSMASLVEVVDKDTKIKSKKHGKSEPGFDGAIAVDIDRLAARKRRFEDAFGKSDRLKRASEEEDGRLGLRKFPDGAKETESDKTLMLKGMHKKEHHKDKSERMVSVYSPRDEQDSESNSMGLSLELQSRLGELTEDPTDALDPLYLKMEYWGSKNQSSSSLTKISDGGSLDLDESNKQIQGFSENEEHGIRQYSDTGEGEERFVSHIDQSNRKQMEQSRWLRHKLGEPDRFGKSESPQDNDTDDFEKHCMALDAGKPAQEFTNDDFPSCKRKKLESFDFEILNAKRECSFGNSQQLNEDIDQSITSSIGSGHFSTNEEDETAQLSLLVMNKDIKSSPKADDKMFSRIESLKYNLDLKASRFHSPDAEFPKLKSTLLGCDEELLQRWERRIKSDSLRMEMTFPSGIVKHESIRKRLGHDLEPGEVQSDSDDDGENKHHSPKSNTSLSYILREREERLTDLKLSGSLEKNKFYSFALDKTITPDTKALLERAKTLYSSREDNWSFLPSCFPSSHSCSDKEKVELAPRPIPSWYMKKKKIRTDSEGKLHDKKEELKPQDQERQELFASRFLHSSIFEQDSRRLQHLERKDQDLEMGVNRPLVNPGATEAQPVSGGGDIPQEPIVLFHSRFLELQQQKDKDHPPHDTESVDVVVEMKKEEVQNGDNEMSVKIPESVLKAEVKSVSPSLILPVSPFVPSPREMSPTEGKEVVITTSSEHPIPIAKEEHILEVSAPQSPRVEDIKTATPKLTISPPPVLSEPETELEPKMELSEPKVKMGNLTVEHAPVVEDKPPTPGGSLSRFDAEPANSDYPKLEEKVETIKAEPQAETQESKHFEEPPKPERDNDTNMPELEPEIKPLPSRKQPKSKRAKSNVSATRTPQHSQTAASEKPATRKSERIDREKLKRASSPRGEVSKAPEPKTTAKSPIHASDSEQNLESSLIHGRTRRRNVRSVYATPHDGEQAGKEVVESSRSMRKRGADKEQMQQDVPNPSTNTRRGRPPKRGGKRGEDVSPVKVDQQKVMEEDLDVKETSSTMEVLKPSEGWRSPRTQKLQQAQVTSPAGTSVNKKTSKLDKHPEIATSPAEVAVDSAGIEESEPKPKTDSEMVGKHSEKDEKQNSPVHRKEKDLKDHSAKKSSEGDDKKIDSTCSERRQPPEKSGKVKAPRLKRNAKQVTEDKSHSLKNLEIRVSVDDVKGLLRSEEDEPESFDTPTTKTKPELQENEETKITCFLKEAEELNPERKEETLSEPEPEPPADPVATLLARQMELEQAVQNIAKLTVEQTPRPYKEPPAEPPTLLPPVIVEPEAEVEEEKPAMPASETELAAAIDSITAEDISADADGFTAPPTYTALIPTPEPLVSPSSNEIMEPETHMSINNILAADVRPLTPSPKPLMAEDKTAELPVAVPDDPPPREMPRKAGKVRAKTPKKSRSRKGAANRKGETTEEASESEPSPIKLPESIPEDLETINSKAATVTAASTAAASVVTAAATCKRDITSTMTVDTPKEAEQPAVEQPVPQESAFHSGTSSTSDSKKHSPAAEPSTPALAPSPVCTPHASQFSVPLPRPGKMSVSLDWLPRSEESRIYTAPSSQVTVVTSSAPTVNALGTPSGNPPMPPDTKASDIDPCSSTLRKILMEPKYVSASNSNAIPTTMVTPALADPPRMSENENPSDTVSSRHIHFEERPPLPPQPTHHKPSPLTESQQNCGEKMQHSVISSPTTSVISRIPMPYDTEETPRISLSNRNIGLSLPKQKFRSNANENSRYHGMDTIEDGNRGRSVVENTPYNTGSSPGLRVNTSEGVVVLSYSGQKTEGPQRMRAKISQIPQASAGDIEFQQSVSKSQIKQEPLTPLSQPPTPKGPPTPTAYGHPGVLLSGQSYNSQPVISSIKQECPMSEKSEAPYHTGSQGGVVKMFQLPVTSPQVLMYNQAVIQQQHGKRGPGVESVTKKMDISKPPQPSNLSPVMSPHHPSLSGTRISPSPGISTDRLAPHLKQEPQSPRTNVHSPSPFAKAPSNSPIGSSVVLGPGMPAMSPYHSGMHHPHPEQSSVIMQPHSVTQSMAHEVRMNTPPMSAINYGRRADSLPSPRPGPPQRSNTPQTNVIRDMVLQSHAGPQSAGGSSSSSSSGTEEEPRHFHQAHRRPSVPQLQPDLMMMQSDHRGLHPGLRLDQYRDMHQRILMHQHQLGEQAAAEARQSRTPEAGTTSSNNISGPSKSPLVGKTMAPTGKETPKPLEGKMSHQPHAENRIMGVHPSGTVMVSSHPQGVQLIHPGSPGSFPVYRDMRGFPSQFPGHPSLGLNLATRGIAPSQVKEQLFTLQAFHLKCTFDLSLSVRVVLNS